MVEQSRGACVIPPNEDECRTAAIGRPDRESLAIPDTRGAQAAVGRVYERATESGGGGDWVGGRRIIGSESTM